MRITLGAIKSLLALAVIAALVQAPVVHAQSSSLPLSVRDSFPLGTGGNALCQVQSRAADAAIQGPFDRAWAVVCRDSALPVGYIFALRRDGGDPAARLAQRRALRPRHWRRADGGKACGSEQSDGRTESDSHTSSPSPPLGERRVVLPLATVSIMIVATP